MSLKGKMKYIFVILAFLILAGASMTYRSLRPANKIPYMLATVEKGTLVKQVLATGTINAEVTIQIGSQVSGTVKEIYVDYNSPVRKGQLLALIDPDAFQAQLAQAESSLESSKANLARQEANLLYSRALLEKADVQLKEAEINANRMRKLFNEGLISKSQLESTETSFFTAWAEKKAQEALYNAELQAQKAAQIAQSNGAVTLARVTLNRTEIIPSLT
jgi:HlyD family secretion protein